MLELSPRRDLFLVQLISFDSHCAKDDRQARKVKRLQKAVARELKASFEAADKVPATSSNCS